MALVAAGIGRVRGPAWARRLYPVALGMLLYTVVNSAGYYAQLGELPVVGMFTALTVATLGLLAQEVSSDGGSGRDGSRQPGIGGDSSGQR